jgi:small subunit ribosomal protein S7
MSRRRVAEKRVIQPDPQYNDQVVGKFINCVMTRGKKSLAEKIVYGSFYIIKEKLKIEDPLLVFKKALEHVSPIVEIKARRVGGSKSCQSYGFSYALANRLFQKKRRKEDG